MLPAHWCSWRTKSPSGGSMISGRTTQALATNFRINTGTGYVQVCHLFTIEACAEAVDNAESQNTSALVSLEKCGPTLRSLRILHYGIGDGTVPSNSTHRFTPPFPLNTTGSHSKTSPRRWVGERACERFLPTCLMLFLRLPELM